MHECLFAAQLQVTCIFMMTCNSFPPEVFFSFRSIIQMSGNGSPNSSSSETGTDEEPEYPQAKCTDAPFGVSKKDRQKRGQRFRTNRRSPMLEFVELSEELNALNQVETKCGKPQVLTSSVM